MSTNASKLLKLCLALCAHVCVHMSAHMGVGPEVNLRYYSLDTIYLVFETGQSLTKQARLVSQITTGIYPQVIRSMSHQA